MPPPLDLSNSTHASFIVASPRLNLRRGTSYTGHDRTPLSSTSARFNFNHLLFSPPPSPSLPALVPRPKRRSSDLLKSRPSRVLRRAFYLAIVITAFYFLAVVTKHSDSLPDIWPYFADEEFELVEQDAVPNFPTPIIVHDKSKRPKWTVSIPSNYGFPLSVQDYTDFGGQCREVSARARELHHKAPLTEQEQLQYDKPDDYFVDVHEAEQTGLIPATKAAGATDQGHFVGMSGASADGRVCETSMTFVLESNDAGMGNILMMLWTFYGLAREEGRAFFIDDSRWAYGRYTDIFAPPPIPECRPPPRRHIIPCPFQARHLAVSSASAQEVFPALLAKHQGKSGSRDNTKPLFDLARTGYDDLFLLVDDDQHYVEARRLELREKAKPHEGSSVSAPIVGSHIRHGDRHPLEYQYRETYIPAEVFHLQAQRIIENHYKTALLTQEGHRNLQVVASDDPMVHKAPDFAETMHAQERIRLASKEAMPQVDSNQDPAVLHAFAEESFGWEGGFFAPMFWNLGVDSKNNAANAPEGVELDGYNEEARHRAPPSDQTLQLRSLIGRAYMMDLAVLSGASDNVICAVSAIGCRLLAVMMGWERAMEKGAWVNVDGHYGWTGIEW